MAAGVQAIGLGVSDGAVGVIQLGVVPSLNLMIMMRSSFNNRNITIRCIFVCVHGVTKI